MGGMLVCSYMHIMFRTHFTDVSSKWKRRLHRALDQNASIAEGSKARAHEHAACTAPDKGQGGQGGSGQPRQPAGKSQKKRKRKRKDEKQKQGRRASRTEGGVGAWKAGEHASFC
jgi:hypothetical protein